MITYFFNLKLWLLNYSVVATFGKLVSKSTIKKADKKLFSGQKTDLNYLQENGEKRRRPNVLHINVTLFVRSRNEMSPVMLVTYTFRLQHPKFNIRHQHRCFHSEKNFSAIIKITIEYELHFKTHLKVLFWHIEFCEKFDLSGLNKKDCLSQGLDQVSDKTKIH